MTRRGPLRLDKLIADLLEPQERFEAIQRQAQLRSGASLRDLAHTSDRPDAGAIAAIRDSLDDDRNLTWQYTPYGGASVPRRLVAGELSRLCRRRFHHRDIVLTSGAMSAINIVFRSLRTTAAVDEVIVITPCWKDYPLSLAQLGFRAVLVPVDPTTLRLDLDRIRAVLSPRTRAVVLSQPSSPAGVIHTRQELNALSALLQDSVFIDPPLLISDECHRDIRFGSAEIVSPIECYPRTCIVFSFGKSLMIEGQRMGYVAVSPDMKHGRAYATLLTQLCRAMGYGTPTALMQRALPRLLDLQPDLSAIAARRERVGAAIRAMGYELPDSQATFYLYPRAPRGDDFGFTAQFAQRGVLVLPSSLFHHAGHIGISMTATDPVIDAALPVLAELAPVESPLESPVRELAAAS